MGSNCCHTSFEALHPEDDRVNFHPMPIFFKDLAERIVLLEFDFLVVIPQICCIADLHIDGLPWAVVLEQNVFSVDCAFHLDPGQGDHLL